MSALINFKKGGAGKAPVRTPDTLVSNDTLETLVAISEGPIKGPVDGPKSIMLDDTPLVNPGTGEPNFENFKLDFYPGNPLGDEVKMELGGYSNPINIGVELAQGTPVVRNGVQTGVDGFDFRVVVNALYRSNDNGTFTHDLELLFEYKKRSQSTWTKAWIAGPGTTILPTTNPSTPTTPSSGDYTNFTVYGGGVNEFTFDGDELDLIINNGVPTVAPVTDEALAVDSITGNYYHWDSSGNTWELSTVTPIDGGSDEVTTPTRTKKIFKGSEYPTGPFVVGDIWYDLGGGIFGLTNSFRVWNGEAWVPRGAKQPTTTPGDGIWKINAKATSATPKDIRVLLSEPSDEPLDWRVTKLSDDSGTTHFSSVSWESVQELKRTPYIFYDLSMIHLVGRASDQFTSMPNINGIYEGRMVKVPSNYNEVTRTYTGIWDGLYKIAYTNNTAFIFQDFVENTTYGLSSIYPHTVNKWKIYEWAQYCDETVYRYDNTPRPRWTYNDYITEPRDAREAAQFIAGTAAARYVDDGNGVVDIIIDRDDPAVALFTPENVSPEGFSYSYTDRQTRANMVTVNFINPDLNWQEDTRYVSDQADIDEYGLIPETFIAVGAIDLDEAEARARRRLIGGLTEKEMVSFATNRKGRYLSEWDVVLVADPDMGRGLTGRIHSQPTANSVTLRDPITLEPGFTYVATFDIPNPDFSNENRTPYSTVERTVTTTPGTVTTLTFSSNLPSGIAENATFTLGAAGVVGLPKPYRIINIDDDTGSGEYIKVSCLELNRNKFVFTDTATNPGTIEYSSFNSEMQAATSPVISVVTETMGSISQRKIRLSWTKSVTPWVKSYTVKHRVDGSVSNSITTDVNFIEVPVTNGVHKFTITPVNVDGREGPSITINYEVVGNARQPAAPTNLRLVGGLTSSTFDVLDPKFSWDPPAVPDPNFKNYRVKVIKNAVVVNTIDVGMETSWTYTFEQQKADGLTRSFTVKVYSVDQFDFESLGASLAVSNAAPAAPTLTVSNTLGGVNVVLSSNTERDLAGAMVWASTTNGFDPQVVTPVQRAPQGSFFIPTASGVTNYFRAAYYDAFSDDVAQLNISSQASSTAPAVAVSDIGMGAITPSRISTGSSLNMIADPGFTDTVYWVFNQTGATVSYDTSTNITGLGAAKGLKFLGDGGTTGVPLYSQVDANRAVPIALTGGEVLYLQSAWRNVGASSAILSIQAQFTLRNSTLTYSSVTLVSTPTVTGEGIAYGRIAAPNNAISVTLRYIVTWPASVARTGELYVAHPLVTSVSRLGRTMLREDGSTLLTDALAVTSMGTAAAITGQGALATTNTAAWGSQISGRPANVSALAGSEDINNNRLSGNVLSIQRPAGGAYNNSTDLVTGAFKIILPQGWSNTMLAFRVRIYNYSNSTWSEYQISGYNYSGTPGWHGASATMTGSRSRARTVRFGYDSALSKAVVWIGDPTDTWSYPKVEVLDFQAGHISYAESQWATGWSIVLDTAAATNVTVSITAPRAGDAIFGEGIFEASGGSVATTNNFKTALGTAAAITGQGSLATANTASWGSQVSGRPANVSALVGTENIQNTLIGIDAAGVVTGIGAGAGTSVANNRLENNVVRISQPTGGTLWQTGISTGAIRIKLPLTTAGSNTMIRFKVDIYEYQTNKMQTYEVGGYTYSPTPGWTNVSARLIGGSVGARTVRFGVSGTNWTVWIGDEAGTWSYPSVVVRDVQVSFNNVALATWETGWVLSLDTSAATNVTATVTTPVAGDAIFGLNALESLGGAVATTNNFKTALGTAAAITGQGSLATLSAVALDSQVTDGTTYKRYATTEQTKLAGVATGATVGARSGTNLFRTDGSTILTQAEIRTAEGVAASIAGQGTLATASTANYRTQVTNTPQIAEQILTFNFANSTAALAYGHTLSNTTLVSFVTTGENTGKGMQIGDNSGNDELNWFGPDWTPYNPSDLYEIVFDVEFGTSGASAVFYAGVEARDRAGNNLGATYNYVCASGLNQSANAGRKTLKGYLSGWTSSSGSGVHNDPLSPGGLPDGTFAGYGQGGAVQFRPMLIANYNTQPGQVTVHSVRINRVPGALATQTNVLFGSNYLLESLGGAVATTNNFKTSLGTAAAITGQGSFATLSAIDSTLANTNNLLRRSSGGLFSGDLAATVGARSGTNLFRTDGSTILTQAEIRTAEGVAASITGQTAAATAADTLVFNNRLENNLVRVAQPVGGTLQNQAFGVAGAIRIKLPLPTGTAQDSMIRFAVDIYEYATGKMQTYEVGGYTYNATSAWTNVSARMIGSSTGVRPVRFGLSGGYWTVWIGDEAGTWSYPAATVRDVQVSYGNRTVAAWETGWVLSFDTSAATSVTATVTTPVAGDTIFGLNALESLGGAVATTNNFKTSLGTAAAITGQGALATASSANYRTQVTNAPQIAEQVLTFNFADITAMTAAGWTVSVPGNASIVTTGENTGKGVQLGDNSGDDTCWIYGPDWIPYNPRDLYEIVFDVEIVAASVSAVLYAGVTAQDRAGNNLGGSNNYVAISGQNQLAQLGRKTFKGYLSGWTTGQMSPQANDPLAPAGLPDGTYAALGQGGAVKFKPIFIGNYGAQSGQVIVHSIRVNRIAGALSTQTNVLFGSNYLLESLGGAVATTNNFKTSLGTAAAITGQGSLATLSAVALDSQVTDGTTYKRYATTEQTKLAGVATGATVGARSGTNLFRTDGSTILTQAEIRTAEGVAASIAGQGTLATLSAVSGTNLVSMDPTSIIGDPDFADASAWNLSPANSIVTSADPAVLAMGAVRALKFSATGINGQYQAAGYKVNGGTTRSCEPNATYRITFNARALAGFNGRLFFQANVIRRDGSITYWGSAVVVDGLTTPLATTNDYVFELQVPTPADAVSWTPQVYVSWDTTWATRTNVGDAYVTNFRIQRAIDSKLAIDKAFRLNKHIAREDGTTHLTDSLAVTSLGTAAAITGQGSFATLSSINSTLADTNNLLRRSSGGLFSGDLAATVGARSGTNLFRTDGSTILTQAEIRTAEGVAASVTGQGALATLSSAAWGSQVSGRPTELTDGRVATGLNASGYLTSGLNAQLTTTDMMAGITGTQLSANPEFVGGSMAGYGLYNNGGGTSVVLTTEADTTAKNGTKYRLKISYDGTGTPDTAPSPGFGGVIQGILDAGAGVSRPGRYARNSRVLYRIWANIPVGRSLQQASNDTGTDGGFTWITSTNGTGAWALYMGIRTIGTTGTFGDSGHLYISGGTNTAFNWYIAKYEQIDITSSARNFLGRSLLDSAGTPRFDADLITTQGVAASISGQGSFATLSSINSTLADTNNLLRRSSGGLFSGDLAATVGARSGTNLFRTDGSTILTQAEIRTAEGVAASVTGQGALATLSSAAWGSQVSGRPTELTDGRVATGLNASGYLTSGLNAQLTTTDMMAGITGTQLSANPEFVGGSTTGYILYGGGTSLALTTEADTTAKNGTKYRLKISYNGTGTPGTSPAPGFGGVVQSITDAGAGVSRPGYYARNSRVLYRIWANIPVGRSLADASNLTGAEGSFTWITSTAGTGAWALYMGIRTIGTTGTFSSTGHLYISGGTNTAFDWYIAKYEQIDITSSARNFLGRSLLDSAGTPRFDADLITTQGVAASISGQGSFATLSSINSTLADSNSLLRRTSGGLFTGDLTADTTALQAQRWTRNYSVNSATTLPLLTYAGAALPTVIGNRNVRMMVTAITTGTGTVTETRAQFDYNGSAWTVTQISNLGQSSNHPVFLVSGAVPALMTNHASIYVVQVTHEYLSASAIAPWSEMRGAGTPENNATVGARSGTNLFRTDGSTILTQAEIRTAEGVAASVTGQGSLATLSAVALDSQVTDGTTYKRYATTEQTKLAGVATGATVGARSGTNLFRTDGSTILTQAEIRTVEGVAASITGQAATATSSDFSAITGTTRPSPNAGTSGVLTAIGTYSSVVGNSVVKTGGTHGAYEGGAVGVAQVGSAYIKSNLLSAVGGGGWDTFLALDDDATSFALSTTSYAVRYNANIGSGTAYFLVAGSQVASASVTGVTAASRMTLAYDGASVFVEIDGVRLWTYSAAADQKLWPKVLDFYNSANLPIPVIDVQYGAWTVAARINRIWNTAASAQYGQAALVTAEGVAATIAGQGSLATLSSVALDTHVTDGTTYKRYATTEQTKLAGVATGATVGARSGTNLFRTDGSTILTQAEIRTAEGVAASITGQAATATSTDFSVLTGATKPANNATVGAVSGTNLFRTDGSTILTQAEIRTAEGVAASVTGQGALATLSAVALDSQVTDGTTYKRYATTEQTKLAGVATGATVGARSGTNLFRTDGSTILTQAEIRTVEGVAASVTGQGSLATLSSVDTPQVAVGAVQRTSSDQTVGVGESSVNRSGAASPTKRALVKSYTFTVDTTGKIEVLFHSQIDCKSGNLIYFYMKFTSVAAATWITDNVMDNADLAWTMRASNQDRLPAIAVKIIAAGLTPGTHTVEVWWNDAGSGSHNHDCNEPLLKVTESKKAS